ncbi:MAG: hypothetical protein ACI8QC_000268 [Planctomycetota bacterium]|jgi:hypothetical protein
MLPLPQWSRRPLALIVILGVAAAVSPQDPTPSAMARSAAAFLECLDDEQQLNAQAAYADADRLDWHFIPRERTGLPLGNMDAAQQASAWALLGTALSNRGIRRVQGVIALEGVLRELESTPEKVATWRDPGSYFISIFGDPLGKAPWAWRLEGHHISLSVTCTADGVRTTPFFLGANPRVVAEGLHAGFALLAEEDAAARKLYLSLDEEAKQAAQAGPVEGDVILGPGQEQRMPARGLPATDMNTGQRASLHALIEIWASLLSPKLARTELARLRDTEFDQLVFAWVGPEQEGKAHGWRIFSESFALEWITPNAEASHVHALWRDLTRDFGRTR